MGDTLPVILSTRDGVRRALDGARPVAEGLGAAPGLRLGRITDVHGNGRYAVKIVDEGGNLGTEFTQVPMVPDTVELADDDYVWLAMPPTYLARPVIMGAVGGGAYAASALLNCGIIGEY